MISLKRSFDSLTSDSAKDLDSHVDEADSSSKKNIVWTSEMDECMTDALVEQAHRGQKIDRSFTTAAYRQACQALLDKFQIKVSVNHVKNRLKTLKKTLAAFQDMENKTSGFAFNRSTGMMDAEPSVWEVYLKAHPEAKPFRFKPLPSFENLQSLFGKGRATGLGAETSKERRMRFEKEKEADVSSYTENVDLEDTLNVETQESGQASKTSFKRKRRANSSANEDFKLLKSGMESVAKAIEQSNPQVLTPQQLFDEVLKIEGLDEDLQLIAYDYVCGDATRGSSFVGLPVDRRRRWLELKLGDNFKSQL